MNAPEGTIVNPRAPAAVAARGLTGVRIGDTVFGALAQIRPELVPACGANAPEIGVSFGATGADGRPHVYLDLLVGSWGGGPDHDGMDACTGTLVNYANTPAELIEADLPIAVERYGFAADTGGQAAGAVGSRWNAIFASRSTGARCRSGPTGASTSPTVWTAAVPAHRRPPP